MRAGLGLALANVLLAACALTTPPGVLIFETEVAGYRVTVHDDEGVVCVRTETDIGPDPRGCPRPDLDGLSAATAFSTVEVVPGVWSVGQVELAGDLKRLVATSNEGTWEAVDEQGTNVLWVEVHGDLETVKVWRLEDASGYPWIDANGPFSDVRRLIEE